MRRGEARWLSSLPKRKAEFIEPMDCAPVTKLADGPGWLYEIKFDGYRAVAVKSDRRVTLFSRRRKSFDHHYPLIVEALAELPEGTVVDGEIVALDESGRPNFNRLQNFRSEASHIHYFIFDLLICLDRDLTGTVVVVSNDASVTANKDGSISMTSTTTTQTYTFNQAGNMTGGQYQTEGTALTIGANGQTTTQPITDSGKLTIVNAMHQFGAGAVEMFQSGFADTRGTLARFPGTVAADAKAHKGRYFFQVAEVGLLFVPVAQEAEGIKMSVELHVAFVELAKALAGE